MLKDKDKDKDKDKGASFESSLDRRGSICM